jgi:hypothetical protein
MLCPVTVLSRLLGMVDAPSGQLAFTYLTSTGKLEFFTHKTFIAHLKAELVASGYDASRYAGHSFRRGGATFAFSVWRFPRPDSGAGGPALQLLLDVL